MIAIWLTIKAAIALLTKFLLFLGAGAVIGVAATVLRPWLGIVGNAIMGAAVVAVLVLSGWATDDSKRVRQLEAENQRLERKTTELKLLAKANEKFAEEAREAQAHNEKVMEQLRSKMGTLPDCTIPKGIVDELRKIR